MLNGFLAGGLVGTIVAAGGLVAASLLAPISPDGPPPRAPETAPPADVAALPETPQEPADPPVQPSLPQIGAPATAPSQTVPEAERAEAPVADLAPAAVPRADAAAAPPALPAETASPIMAGSGEAPVLAHPQALAPVQPKGEADVVVSTDTATPGPPAGPVGRQTDDLARDAAGPTDPTDDDGPDVAAAAPPQPQGDRGAAAASPRPDVARSVEATGEDAPPPQDRESADASPDGPAGAKAGPETSAGPGAGAGEIAAADMTGDDTTADQEAIVVRRGEAAGMPGGGTEVVVNRAVPAADAPASAPGAPPGAASDENGRPLERFAAGFENPEDLPLMSVVLIDEGDLSGAPAAVAAIGVPVTVAINPGRAGAGEAMEEYRARGIEVAMLPSLPQGASAADVEVTLEAARATLPEAVALVDATGAWQAGGGVAEQALARLDAEGRGFLTISSGLNAGLRAAAAEAVPAALVYRDLDANGQDARVIRRFLDQAAFRARQTTGVVLLGRVRPDTISALTLWSTANRADQVALAPLSATLRHAED